MQRSRPTRIIVRAAAVLVVLLLGLASRSALERRRTQAEFSVVLSAFFSDGVPRDTHGTGSRSGVPVIILREGPRSLMWKQRWLDFPLDWEPLFPQASLITRSSFWLSNVVSTGTEAELHSPKAPDFVVLGWSELDSGQPGDFERRFPAYFAVSQAGFNFSKTEAIFYVDQYCSGLCGGGGYVLMRKVGGVWSVVSERMVWES